MCEESVKWVRGRWNEKGHSEVGERSVSGT